jgi:hypothetical protein
LDFLCDSASKKLPRFVEERCERWDLLRPRILDPPLVWSLPRAPLKQKRMEEIKKHAMAVHVKA